MFLFMLLVTYFDIYRPVYCHFNKDTKLSQGQGRPLREVLIVYFKIIRSFTQAPTFSSAIVLISRDFIPNIIRTLQNTNKSKCVSLIEFWSFMVQYNCNKYIVNKSKDGNRFCQLIQSQFRKQLLLTIWQKDKLLLLKANHGVTLRCSGSLYLDKY